MEKYNDFGSLKPIETDTFQETELIAVWEDSLNSLCAQIALHGIDPLDFLNEFIETYREDVKTADSQENKH